MFEKLKKTKAKEIQAGISNLLSRQISTDDSKSVPDLAAAVQSPGPIIGRARFLNPNGLQRGICVFASFSAVQLLSCRLQ